MTVSTNDSAFHDYIAPLWPLLSRDDVSDVMLNEPLRAGDPGPVFADVVGKGLVDTGVTVDAAAAQLLIRAVAASKRQPLDKDHPVLSAMHVLSDGTRWRFEASLPPASTAPTITVRKYLKTNVTLAGYVERGELTAGHADLLAQTVCNRGVVLISGSTGDGKTTVANALLRAVGGTGEHRAMVIEDSPELEVPHPLSTRRESNEESEHCNTRALVKHAMRSLPSVLVIGELRDGRAAVECVEAWNTGHGGFTTLHAPSATGALWRLYDLVRKGSEGPVDHAYVSRSVALVVHVKRVRGRRVFTVARCLGWDGTDFRVEVVE